jgi:hypothetical protein
MKSPTFLPYMDRGSTMGSIFIDGNARATVFERFEFPVTIKGAQLEWMPHIIE